MILFVAAAATAGGIEALVLVAVLTFSFGLVLVAAGWVAGSPLVVHAALPPARVPKRASAMSVVK